MPWFTGKLYDKTQPVYLQPLQNIIEFHPNRKQNIDILEGYSSQSREV